MGKRILYIIIIFLVSAFSSLQICAQQPSIYEIKRMPFNINGFNNISPVIVRDGIIFCSDRRFSVFRDRTSFDGRRLYNIYMAVRKDTSGFSKPIELTSERSNKFNNGPLCLAPDGTTVYFTSEVETGKMADNKKFKNHSGIFIAELKGLDLVSVRPFKYNDLQKGYFSSNRGKEDDIYQFISTIIRKATCDTLEENNYCYRFFEENAMKHDTMPFRYEWRFGDGKKGTGKVVEHCFAGPGTFTVQLDVVNLITKEVTYNEKSETIVVTDIEQPYISAPDRISTNQNISMNADSTNLPDWKISRYYWNFGDETVAVGKEVPKSYLKPGTYNIQLIVTAEPEPGAKSREACISKNIIVFPKP